jgi:hypothetical protein
VDLPADEAQRAVVWNPLSAPDRDFKEVRRGSERRASRGANSGGAGAAGSGAVSRGDERAAGGDGSARVYVKPSPGDSLPELHSDPMTTIPTPESRRAKTIGQDGFKEEQDRKNTHDGSALYGEVFVSPAAGETVRPRRSNAKDAEPQPSPASGGAANGATKPVGNRDQATKDPLLSRFFRSITRSDADRAQARDPNARDAGTNPNDDGSARRRESQPKDDSAAKESNPPDRARPAEARPANQNRDQGRDKSAPAGGAHSQPRKDPPPPPQATPRGGTSDDHATRRMPGQDR